MAVPDEKLPVLSARLKSELRLKRRALTDEEMRDFASEIGDPS